MGVGGGDGIRIHAEDLDPGKQCLQFLLDPLGPHTDEVQPAAAGRTRRRKGLRIAAVMAHQPSVGGVVGQPHRASWALRDLSAFPAGDHAAAAPAVQEQDALLPTFQVAGQLPAQLRTDGGAVPRPQLPLHIHNADLRHGLLVEALAQGKQTVAPLPGLVHGLHRRGG